MFSYGFLWENVHLGYGYFLRLDLVGNDLPAGTKSESTCYDVIITSLPTSCYPTSTGSQGALGPPWDPVASFFGIALGVTCHM